MLLRLATLFFSMFVGWAVAFVLLIYQRATTSRFGYITDFDFLLFWPLAFAFLSWILVGIPFVIFVKPSNRFLKFPISILSGASIGFVTYFVLIGWLFLFQVWQFPVFAAVMGAIAFPLYVANVNKSQNSSSTTKRILAISYITLPIILFMFVKFLMWPGLENYAPNFAFKYGTIASQFRIFENVMRDVKVGDRFEDLQKIFPSVFDKQEKWYSRSYNGKSYFIEFDSGRVSNIKIDPPAEKGQSD